MFKFKIEVETKPSSFVPYSQQPPKLFTSMIEMERRTTKLSTTLVNKTLTVEQLIRYQATRREHQLVNHFLPNRCYLNTFFSATGSNTLLIAG